MKLELALRTLPVALCAVLGAVDAHGQASADTSTKSMKAPPTAAKPATRGVRIGVTINPLTEALAAQLGLEANKGILVEEVLEGGPAAKAGLHRYDVIVAMNDDEVSGETGLRNHLAGLKAGDTVTIKGAPSRRVDADPRRRRRAPGRRDHHSAARRRREERRARAAVARSRVAAAGVDRSAARHGRTGRATAGPTGPSRSRNSSARSSRSFRAQHASEIKQWTDTLVAKAEQWRDQAAELDTPENREKFEAETRALVEQLVEKARSTGDWLRVPAIRYFKSKDGVDQAIIESGESPGANGMPLADTGTDVRTRLDRMEQRMEKIERMLEQLTAAQAGGSGGR
jgi:hypothetical protein